MILKRIFLLCCALYTVALAAQSPQIDFTAPRLYPEGIAYDPGSDLFYVSSVYTGTIGSVTPAGSFTSVYVDSSLKSTFGMKVDAAGKRLWVLAGDPSYSRYRDSITYKKMIRLVAIDLGTRQKVQDIDLSPLFAGKHFGNDLTLDDNGNIYITDSYSPVIYKVDASGKASVFSQSNWYTSAGVGLNGIVYHPDGFLLVANNGNGVLLKVDIRDPQRVSKVVVPQFFPGADGLLLDEQGQLLLVQNKGVNKVFRLMSTDRWMHASVNGMTAPKDIFSFPSTVTMRKGTAWVMNAKMQELSDSTTGPSQQFFIKQAVLQPVK